MPKVLCVIPCRKGSKRLPDKTIMKFKGMPLVQWTINQAKQLFKPEQIIVNSDYNFSGIEDFTYYKRPEHLCGDNITTEAVLRDMLKDFPEREIIVLLQLTSPNRKLETIRQCIAKAYETKENVRTERYNQPDGQVYIWWTNKPWGNWEPIEAEYVTDINTQLDFEIAEILHE